MENVSLKLCEKLQKHVTILKIAFEVNNSCNLRLQLCFSIIPDNSTLLQLYEKIKIEILNIGTVTPNEN